MLDRTETTLNMLLDSREARQERQRELIRRYKGAVVSITVVRAGKIKRTDSTLAIAEAAVAAVEEAFKDRISYCEKRDLATGYEALYALTLSSDEAKNITTAIEEEHPLGRFMDIDVIGADGKPVSRRTEPRRCLICGNDAHICMRSGAHSAEEINEVIDARVKAYTENKISD